MSHRVLVPRAFGAGDGKGVFVGLPSCAGWAALALGLASCAVDPYCLTCIDDASGGVGDAGEVDSGRRDGAMPRPDGGGNVEDGSLDGCAPGASELCNGADDDCDGMVDEGIDLSSSLEHCGGCGRRCAPPGAFGRCERGMCGIGGCDVGYHDLDGDPDNGCEYRCLETDTAERRCDRRDDDCDGRIDEDFDLDRDPSNCGACGRVCRAAHASPACIGGSCGLGACEPGFFDLDGNATNGCEYACTPASPPDEACNLRDDDCDGRIDEGDPGGGSSCGTDVGECVAGVEHCRSGAIVCVGSVGPTVESCNGLDDDCDGNVDETFAFATDPMNCGMCGRVCSFPNARAVCMGGGCAIAACAMGFVDADGMVDNGCEYMCDFAGAEVCNGRDDDCDTRTDEGLVPPATFCNPNGVCAGTTARCAGSRGWVCDYPPTYQSTETRCDGLDNDCNGRVDDPYPLVGTSCTNGELGACRRTGTYVCNGTGDGVLCNAPPSGGGMPETCNGVDDDCDGRLDEGARTQWVQVRASPALWIMAYEASRPDATSRAPGVLTHTACSEPMRMPWVNVTQSQAASACTAAGGRLCTETEWQLACQAGMGCTWSFASACTTLSTTTCNFNEYDTTPGGGDDDAVLPTGSLPMCYARWAAGNVHDLSGNVAEWTSTSRSSGAGTVFVVRGGSTTTPSGGATCSFDFVVAAPTVTLPNLGFRCCRDTPPP